ncbi:MAG: lipid II flippase MurJ [Nitrospira sp.]|nr:polysaccharide biosynthesis C-terminal domain-containing protein [Nitrospira sp.]
MEKAVGETLSVQSWTSASVMLVGVTGASKALGFFRELLLASYLGASGQVDAYAVAYSIPLFLIGGVGYGFSTSIVPGYHQKVAECGREAGTRFLATMCLSTLVWSLLLLIPVWTVPEVLVWVAAPSLPDGTARLTADLMGWLALYVLLLNMVYVLSATFHALNHFRVPAASELVFNLTALGVFVGLVARWEVRALVIGNLVGIAACGLLLAGALFSAKSEWRGRMVRPREVFAPLLTALPIAAYYVCSQFPSVLANYFAGGLAEGSIAAFSYARTLLTAVVTLVTLSVARGAFPTFAILFSSGKRDELRRFVTGLGKLVVLIFVPLSIVAIVYREPVLRMLYQRGVFDDAALQLTVTAFACLAIGLTFAAWEPIGTRALYAVGDAQSPLLATTGSACLLVPLLMVLTPVLGLGGVGLSLSLALAADSALQMLYLGRRLESPIWRDLASFLAKCIACALLAGGVLFMLPGTQLGVVLSGTILFAGAYVLLVQVLVQPIRSIVTVAATR